AHGSCSLSSYRLALEPTRTRNFRSLQDFGSLSRSLPSKLCDRPRKLPKSASLRRFLDRALAEAPLITFQYRRPSLEQRFRHFANSGRGRRTAWKIKVDRHHGMNRHNSIKQDRHDFWRVRYLGVQCAGLCVDRPEYFQGDSQRVAKGRHVAGDRTVAEGNQELTISPDALDH